LPIINQMRFSVIQSSRYLIAPLILILFAIIATAEETSLVKLDSEFTRDVVPLLQSYCVKCHDNETHEAELNLSDYRGTSSVIMSDRVWATVLHRVSAGEMPPVDATSQPTQAQRETITGWIERVRKFEAERNAGDPGSVIARRLSNAEFDYSIRDLTGADIQPTKTFPVDPANEAGFDNSGESLTMSPALLTKYLEASRVVIDHMILTPRGITFASHPVVTDTDRDKYCVNQIVQFYQQQPTNLADYFFAAWTYRHREQLAQANASLVEIAVQQQVSPKYLTTLWKLLTQTDSLGPVARLQSMWESMPIPSASESNSSEVAKAAIEQLRDYVVNARERFSPSIDNLTISGSHNGSQPLVLWKNKQYAKYRRTADVPFLDSDDPTTQISGLFDAPNANNLERFKADCDLFCSVFPDAFYVSERGRDYLGKKETGEGEGKGRLLSAGFHSMMGYFRDDQPLYDLLLDPSQQQELDALWQQLMFVSTTPQRQYQGFLWFEKAESKFMRESQFDFVRSEDKESCTSPMIERLAELYLAKAAEAKADEIALQAARDFFTEIDEQIRWVEQTKVTSQPHHLNAVIDFASRAYRRPLSPADEQELRVFYRRLINDDGLTHDEAIQDMVVSILMSPRFCYRVDLLCDTDQARPLDDYELASRLSYFLWSSLPDEELLSHAAAGNLHETDVLAAQTTRMLIDKRVRGLATEFGGNWLDFRRFEEHNAVDRSRFTSFNDDLRSAMFEEPIRFFIDIIKHDRSVRDFLYADRTFVNATLASHYGMDGLSFVNADWQEVNGASRYGRGGLLPMAVFLTKNAPGLRTSPVKRGYWVVRRLLGERIPPPPPNVPEISNDESKLGDLTLRETLAKHREHASCAGCHDRIDSIGLVFEGFGPIGERRDVDLGGRNVDAQAVFPDGSLRNGVEDLRRYLKEKREGDFIDNISRKLLSYALGRALQLSDETLLQSMRDQSQAEEVRFSRLVSAIVSSPPFLNKRGRERSADELRKAGVTSD